MLSPDKQAALEDRYYNNQNFQDEYSANDPDVQNAATKIQAKFRGHKARKGVEKLKQESKTSISSDQQTKGYGHEHLTEGHDEYQKASSKVTDRLGKENDQYEQGFDGEELTEEEKQKQERAAISIQAQFRGFKTRKTLRDTFEHGDENERQHDKNFDDDDDDDDDDGENKIISSARFHDLDENLRLPDEIEMNNNGNIDRESFELESSHIGNGLRQYSTDEVFPNDDDMSDSDLDKAATRIQASYRGYKARKELGSTGVPDHHHSSPTPPQKHKEFDSARNKNILSPSAEGNKASLSEDDDNAAAVKIQAAYRGYRVRKDLEK